MPNSLYFVDLTDADATERALAKMTSREAATAIAEKVETMQKVWKEKARAEVDYERKFRMQLASHILAGTQGSGDDALVVVLVKQALLLVDELYEQTQPSKPENV